MLTEKNENYFKKMSELFIIIAGLLWGTVGTSQAMLPFTPNPLALGAVRLGVGGLILMLFVLIRSNFKIPQGQWLTAAIFIAGLGLAGFQFFFFSAIQKTGVAVGTMISIGASPIVAGILGYIFQGEKLNKKWYGATFFAIVGCILLVGGGGDLTINLIGILMALIASFCYAVCGLGIKMMKTDSLLYSLAVAVILGAFLLSPAYFTSDFSWLYSTAGIAVAIHLGMNATALAYFLFARGLSRVNLSHAYTLGLIEPLTACLLGILVLKEQVSGLEVIGIILLLIGLIILAMPNLKTSKTR